MSASYVTALAAARDAAAAQDYPEGALYLVATPIGNLADITLRALHVLELADLLACEDTRHSRELLRAYGINKRAEQWLALHQHNEAQAAQAVLRHLAQGKRVAYLSDAGTPAVSDPGARLAAAVHAAGRRCIPLPGASSVTTALSAAGAVAPQEDGAGFVFIGFLPTRGGERKAALEHLAHEPRIVVLLEAPHRIAELARDLAPMGERAVTLARELTKQFESITTLPAGEIEAWLEAAPERRRGEFVVLLHPLATDAQPTDDGEAVLRLLLDELPLKSAVRIATELTGLARNTLYQKALALQGEGND